MNQWDPLSPEAIAPLVRNTIFSGNVHCYGRVASTNSTALDAAGRPHSHHDNPAEGAVFLVRLD